MIRVALTGNIAAGKSEVEKVLKTHGVPLIDADAVCHDLLMNDAKVINEIKKTFSDFDILDEKNNLSKKKLSNIIFNNKIARTKLENILHPIAKEKINEFFEENQNAKFAVASVALLFEAKMQNMFDKIILVSADENIRLQRLTARNNLSKEQAQQMIDAQLPDNSKLGQADYIIKNNLDLDNLINQIKLVFSDLTC